MCTYIRTYLRRRAGGIPKLEGSTDGRKDGGGGGGGWSGIYIHIPLFSDTIPAPMYVCTYKLRGAGLKLYISKYVSTDLTIITCYAAGDC